VCSSNGGVFKFTTSILPADCVGRLSDGVSAIEVVIENCMPALNRLLAPVPQTGQVKCYGRDTRISSCAGTGQDGELQKGVKLPTPRFIDNGNGTFTDNLTGLIWLKNAACLETVRPWLASLDAIVELNALGTMETHDCDDRSNNGTHQTDWRMPNIRELMSLLNYAFRRPAFSNAAGTDQAQCLPEVDCPFSNWQFSEIWSSTSVSDSDIDAGRAWQVNFAFGTADPLDKALPNGLLAVRGGS